MFLHHSTSLKVVSSLYPFTTQTFTNANVTGRTGPTLGQCQTAYSASSWTANSLYFNMTTQGIQEWTVPATGSYTIASAGGTGYGSGTYYGGLGASITGTFNLTQSNVLCVVVGQVGMLGPGSGGCGGGGSFVYRKTDNLLYIVAGGGGGGGHNYGFGGGGSATQTPVNGGGTGNGGYQGIGYGGNGGGNSVGVAVGEWNDAAGGGGGWLSNGSNGIIQGTLPDYMGYGGYGRSSGFIGGYHATTYNITYSSGNGGFGGGGGSGGNGNSGGGGGGYTGGGGGNNWNNSNHGGGQGGGSYNNGTNQSNITNTNAANGYVTITKI